MQRGQTFAAQHELEITVSEMVQKVVPSAEVVRFASSGTEIVQTALRVARGYTGRSKIIKFHGEYHGWMDSVYYDGDPSILEGDVSEFPDPIAKTKGMAPGSADDIIILPWNNLDAVKKALELYTGQIAAIITEPITNGMMPGPGYAEGLRELCDQHGVLLIFDEVITGFRVALGGGQELLGVTPDLSTFAKAMAGGFPVSMLTGKREVMDVMADGTVMQGGTLNSNVMSMAAAEAALNKLMADNGAVYKQLYSISNALMEGLRALGSKHEIGIQVFGPGPVFHMSFTDLPEVTDYADLAASDKEKYTTFYQGMLERGVRIMGQGAWFISTAHSQEDVDKTLAAADEVLATM
jgi:glutamate-1-semialdehyde 2,1-aminomutase